MAAGVVPTSSPRDLALPRRDDEARARLQAVAARTHPFVAAGERRLPVAGRLGELLPSGGVQRGSTIAVDGSPGSGSTTVALTLAAAATSAGEWAAVVDPARPPWSGTLGARAAADLGVQLERLAVVPRVPPDRWGSVVAALLDGITVVVAAVPPHVRLGDARRLVARARERGAVLVAFGAWPVEAAVRVHTGPGSWRGLGTGSGLLGSARAQRPCRGERSRGERSRVRASGMTRTCCVWCPDWPVVAARRRDPALQRVPVFVRERVGARELVRAASAEARAAGVTRGMRRREAEAQCPDAVCVDADDALEARTFEIVARAVEVLTPRVVLDRPGLCAFMTRGPSRYFGGDHALAVRVREGVAAALGGADPDIRVGIADGGFAARLAARRAVADAPFVVDPGGSAAFCAPWPVSALDDPELVSLLVRLGLPTLGDVAALPADAVLARFGADGRRFHDLARGLDAGPPVLVTPPPDLVEQMELDPPVARVDAAAFAAKGLAERLLFRLAERGLACTRVVIEAETEHGEQLARCWRHDHVLTPAALAERVRWQLDGWLAGAAILREDEADDLDSTTGGLTLLRLVPDEVVPADGRQLGFWGGDQAAHDRADRALARVQGLLGYEAVATAVVQGGRTPAEQVRWVPWGDAREPQRPLVVDTFPTAWPGALPSPFPARVLDPPMAAQLSRRARARGRGVGAGRAVGGAGAGGMRAPARRRRPGARVGRAVGLRRAVVGSVGAPAVRALAGRGRLRCRCGRGRVHCPGGSGPRRYRGDLRLTAGQPGAERRPGPSHACRP